MKTVLSILTLVFLTFTVTAQLNFNEFETFKSQNVNLSYSGLNDLYPRIAESYYKGYNNTPDFSEVTYLDSVIKKFSLTEAEQNLLTQNHFFVTERLSYDNFGTAFHSIYANDLPVFVSTDAILHALHSSYDFILKTVERDVMSENLENYLQNLYTNFPAFAEQYNKKGIDESIQDVDLYLSVAYSLITNSEQPVRIASVDDYNEIMKAIENLAASNIGLFCYPDRTRSIDFSQFEVRGHYVYTEMDQAMNYKSLEPYFRAMMWLGRISFYLTAPEKNPWEIPWSKEEIRRMNISATLLNELAEKSTFNDQFKINETIINYLVGESDNVTSSELSHYQSELQISSADQLLSDAIYDPYYAGFSKNPDFQQKIMGGMLFVNPYSAEPDTLPVVFMLSGQRFIIDSYVLSNVVYDRIIYNNRKMQREMPDPLDAAFALGNSDASYFLEPDLKRYHYGANLANMRYLIDQKEEAFWHESLYNSWLGAIRDLSPVGDEQDKPFFMRTAAWHQQKINTQLGSWSQLRHDNLLYAKPSYTGMTGCSYPYSYVEPYPEFYAALADYAEEAGQFFSTIVSSGWEFSIVSNFFPQFVEVMGKLEVLAQKELNNQPFSEEEASWLQKMLFESSGSGAPPYSGWYNQLYVNPQDIVKNEYPIVDLHTQPTDSLGNMVGYVLHAGTGKVNLGTFMVKSPGTNQYVAYTGPFFSYYEKITRDFERLTDQNWTTMVGNNTVPDRPEWTAAYLADKSGNVKDPVIELPTSYLVGINEYQFDKTSLIEYYPNPVDRFLHVSPISAQDNVYSFSIYDQTGKVITSGMLTGNTAIDFSSFKKGLYLLKVQQDEKFSVYKILKN